MSKSPAREEWEKIRLELSKEYTESTRPESHAHGCGILRGFDAACTLIAEPLKAELEKARAENAAMKEALEFYADKKNYGSDDYSRTDGFDCFDVVLNDFSQADTKNCSRHAGRRAREALAKLQGAGEKV